MAVIAVVAAAPCQYFSPGRNQITSPGRISSAAPPPSLRPPDGERDDQCLTQRMRMPRGAGARLERDAGAKDRCRFGRLEQWVNTDCAGEIFGRALAGRPRAHFV
jgi:hypothetical protein